uniref:Uncharacterized protein n=1 Tax=Babesia bovis TaxID=5865 RepID=S6B0D3_BABBO|nr:hypothetical protein [Babesia bovis]
MTAASSPPELRIWNSASYRLCKGALSSSITLFNSKMDISAISVATHGTGSIALYADVEIGADTQPQMATPSELSPFLALLFKDSNASLHVSRTTIDSSSLYFSN